ncbi:MAG TPA: histidine kinase dimerization/phosphoacceptor domain-containing protein [Streptosporangiaceae bacterium]
MERARIARDMHDSVAHHLTVIAALSDGALAAVTRAPAQASDGIRGGLQHRPGGARRDPPPARRPADRGRAGTTAADPGLSDLDGLFTRVRAAGLPVRYERSGPPGTPRPASSWSSSGSFRKP